MSLSSRNIRHLMSSICFAVSRRLASASRESNADAPPAVAQGGKGVVVPGCPMCKIEFRFDRTGGSPGIVVTVVHLAMPVGSPELATPRDFLGHMQQQVLLVRFHFRKEPA